MKSIIEFLLISILILRVRSSTKIEEKDSKDCVWNYKCCKFQETAGVISCTELCDPVINCDLVQVVDNTSSVEDSQGYSIQPAAFPPIRSSGRACRPGYRLDSRGNCRRVLK
jgi:hypothetical protein